MRLSLTLGMACGLLACSICGSALAQDDEIDPLIIEAINQYDQGEYETAVDLLRAALKRDPDSSLAAYELALTYQAQGDWKACIKTARRALRRLDPDTVEGFEQSELAMLQGSCYSALGKADKALKVFREALEEDPVNYGLNFNIAITLLNTGESAAAAEHLESAIRIDPTNPSGYYVLAIAYEELARYPESVLTMLTFLQREFNTVRSSLGAMAVIEIAFSQVQGTETGTTISISSESLTAGREISALTTLLAFSATLAVEEGELRDPLAESLAMTLHRFVSGAAEVKITSPSTAFLDEFMLTPLRELETGGVAETFAYFVINVAEVEGAADWLDANDASVDEMVQIFELRAVRENQDSIAE